MKEGMKEKIKKGQINEQTERRKQEEKEIKTGRYKGNREKEEKKIKKYNKKI